MNDGTTWELPGVTHWDGCGNSKRPEHSGCKIQPGVPLETTLWDEGYSVGVQDSMLRSTQIERVLTDLIAELRAEHYPHPCTDPEDFPCCCESCAGAWPCLMADMADRAEERLQKLDTPPNQI